METKQTAVEWLYDTIIIFPESNDDLAHNAKSFQQAKAMEKEQIIEAYNIGDCNGSDCAQVVGYNDMSAEEWYNIAYKSKQQDK